MLQQISIGKDFDSRNVQLSALNAYVKTSNAKFTQWFLDCKVVKYKSFLSNNH